MDAKTFREVTQWDPLIRFLEGEKPNEEYDYNSSFECPLARFYKSRFHSFHYATSSWVYFHVGDDEDDENARGLRLPRALDEIVFSLPRTYGKLLERAIKAKEEGVPIVFIT